VLSGRLIVPAAEYVQWQEKKEQEIERMQGKLFDKN